MGVIENLIPFGSSRFTHDLGQWTSSQVIERTSTQSFISGVPSISVIANGSGYGKISLSRLDINENYRNKTARAFAWVYLKSSSPCTLYLTTATTNSSAVVSSAENLRGLEWSLVSVESDTLSGTENSHAFIDLEVSGLSAGEEFFVAVPALIIPEMVLTSVSADETYLRLPDYMRRSDLEQSEPTIPLRRFTDVMTTLANDIDTTWNLFYYVPPEDNDGVPLRSYLTEPELADEATLKWLAMVMGTQLLTSASGFTSWVNLLSGADAEDDFPDGVTTWTELEVALDGPDAGTAINWNEIEGYAPALGGVGPHQRWQVSSAAYGLRGGSKASIEAAALQTFKETDRESKTVTITSNYLNDPFHILLEITPMTAEELSVVANYVNPAMPAGFGLTVAIA